MKRTRPARPPALVSLLSGASPREVVRRGQALVRAGLLLGAGGAFLAGQSLPTLVLLLAWASASIHGRAQGPRYPLLSRQNPSTPAEASILALRPGQILRRADEETFLAEPGPGDDRIEIWQTLPEADFSDAWFEAELGPEPRVAGQLERIAPLLEDAGVGARSTSLRLEVQGGWFGWAGPLSDRPLEASIEAARAARARLIAGELFDPVLLEAPPPVPLLSAVALLSDPERYERSPQAEAVRPALRWITRDRRVGLEAKQRALRLLAVTVEPEETVAVLESLNGRGGGGASLGDRAVHHLEAKSAHLKIAAAAVLERVGAPSHVAALSLTRAEDRKYRGSVEAAIERARAAIEKRHGQTGAGALGLVKLEVGHVSVARGLSDEELE